MSKILEIMSDAEISVMNGPQLVGVYSLSHAEAKELLDHMESNNVLVSRWIPVAERLPTMEELTETSDVGGCWVVQRHYNLFHITKYHDVVRPAIWTGEYFADGKTGWGCGRMNDVLFWMPYPAAPKEVTCE